MGMVATSFAFPLVRHCEGCLERILFPKVPLGNGTLVWFSLQRLAIGFRAILMSLMSRFDDAVNNVVKDWMERHG